MLAAPHTRSGETAEYKMKAGGLVGVIRSGYVCGWRALTGLSVLHRAPQRRHKHNGWDRVGPPRGRVAVCAQLCAAAVRGGALRRPAAVETRARDRASER